MADFDNNDYTPYVSNDGGMGALSGAPVTPAAVTPAPAPSGLNTNSPDLDPSSPMNSQPTNTPTPTPPNRLQNLVSALAIGLSGAVGAKHFGDGLARGAKAEVDYNQQQVENQQHQQQIDTQKAATDSTIRFQDAESAYRAASLANQDKQIHVQEQEGQDRHDANVLSLIKMNQDLFGTQYDVVPNTGQHATNWLEQGTANAQAAGQNGVTVPPGTLVSTSNMYVPKNTPSMDTQYKQATQLAGALGLPVPTQQQFNMAGQQGRNLIIERMQNQLMGIDPSTSELYDAKKLPSVVAALSSNISRYAKDPQHNDQMLTVMGSTLTNLKGQLASNNNTPAAQLINANIAKANAETKKANAETGLIGQQKMLDTGVNPYTKEKLTIQNAPDEMLVDQHTGNPIPLKMVTALKPNQTETNRAEFAQSVLHSLDEIDKLKAAGKLPNGPLKGLTQKGLLKIGMSNADAQKASSFISFAQSAATGAHVGGRFSLPVLQKMSDLIGLNMNDSQFQGAEDAMRSVMSQYVSTGGRMTVGEYKQLQQQPKTGTPNLGLINKHTN